MSTAAQDSSIQVGLLVKEGVDRDRVYVDHGISGRQTRRPGLDNAINAAREGDIFCVTKLDRLSRSAGDLHETVKRLAAKGVALSIDGKIYDPTDPMGKMFIAVLGLMTEFESDLIRSRTRDDVAAAAAVGVVRKHRVGPYRAGSRNAPGTLISPRRLIRHVYNRLFLSSTPCQIITVSGQSAECP